MLIIVNPYATTVSDRLRNLVVYALQGRYEVEAVQTEAQNHATEIGREAREGGYDVVVSFGGDGTLNEVANGLAGTDMPMAILPGGSANVVARSLGIPNDVVDATEHLLSLADDWEPRKIDLGRVDERHFVFACGAGIDATVVKRVDSHPQAEGALRPLVLQLVPASRPSTGSYLRQPGAPAGRRSTASAPIEGVTAIAQNSDPFTYFSTKPVYVNEGVAIDNGTLSMAVLKRAAHARHADPPAAALLAEAARRPPPPDRRLRPTLTERRDRVDLRGPLRRPPLLPAPGRRRLHRRAHPGRARDRPRRPDDHRLIHGEFAVGSG